MLQNTGKILILTGAVLITTGLILLLAGKLPFAEKLPGDITIQKKNFHFSFPLATGILISLLLTVIINIVYCFFRK